MVVQKEKKVTKYRNRFKNKSLKGRTEITK